jgi:hypothetical protein
MQVGDRSGVFGADFPFHGVPPARTITVAESGAMTRRATWSFGAGLSDPVGLRAP